MQANESRTVHDWLLRHKPEDVSHDEANCSHCSDKASNQEEKVAEEKIFTQEQHEQLLAAAVEKAVAEATTKMDGEVLRLNEQVEAIQASVSEKDTKIQELETSISERAEQDRLDAIATSRVDEVKAKANFTDEQIEARKATWAKMGDEEFKAYLEDLETVAKASTKDMVPPTVFDGTREAAHDGSEVNILKAILSGDLEGVVS